MTFFGLKLGKNLDHQRLPGVAPPRLSLRGTQRQFLGNICSEVDLRFFGTFVVKVLACLPLLELELPRIFEHLKNVIIVHF